MHPEFRNGACDGEYDLCCPKCGETYVHHGKINVFERAEDDDKGIHVIINSQNVCIKSDLKGNPSLRRNGLTIEFWCELCNCVSVLAIAQHKGTSIVTFYPVPEK
jgi:hypothetical protein